ncbi:MAG: sporulation protein YqfD [Eubacteriales bacterium]|nr:sporulation protein YqfD [Bacillota bacterium]MBV1727164.1 sporulation protein YqfD [Desulforudis sp.]MDZ4041931.1 sporulation protein YqfD [Eubacteriales bacterium]MBU4533796.1 sporulation protein YqfD [Bacillota bacterium]MBV1736347.1 sporulation protein YqfD [Desulforudis sp.]
MFVLRMLSFLLGYVTMVVRGDALERFINMANSRGIRFWDIRRIGPDEILLRTRVTGVKPLRHIARRTGSRFHVSEKIGLPFLLYRLRRRKMMTLGAVLFLFALYFLSSFVWIVDVKGNAVIQRQEIVGVAREAGLYPGASKWRFEVSGVEQRLRDEMPRIAWVGIEIRGTRAYISVAEKKLVTDDNDSPSNILAAKAGLVKEVLVLSGQAVVREGDTVLPGQLLITGEIWPGAILEEKEDSILELRPRYVRSRGIVRARVWYEEYGEVPLSEEIRELTGREERQTALRAMGRTIVVAGARKSPFKDFDQDMDLVEQLGWRNYTVPVEVITTTFREAKTTVERRNRSEALQIAEDRAVQILTGGLPEDIKILNRRVEVVRTGKSEDLVRVKVVLETLEDIGKEKYFQ